MLRVIKPTKVILNNCPHAPSISFKSSLGFPKQKTASKSTSFTTSLAIGLAP
tara:strand:- start:545 stop:700 length:156 start_codon:yes stop_codon:yes gene_type:complete